MSTIEIKKQTAIQEYRNGNPGDQALLIRLYGREIFTQTIMERVKSFEDACAETGDNPFEGRFCAGASDTIAYEKLKVICKALCEGVRMSFKDPNQKKWRPWLVYEGSGFRFWLSGFDYTRTGGGLGSRLCVPSKELADYLGTQFIDLFNQLLKQEHEN